MVWRVNFWNFERHLFLDFSFTPLHAIVIVDTDTKYLILKFESYKSEIVVQYFHIAYVQVVDLVSCFSIPGECPLFILLAVVVLLSKLSSSKIYKL